MPEEKWRIAVHRAEVLAPLAARGVVGLHGAEELGVSRRVVYLLVGHWRQGEGVVSDLIAGKSSGGRGRQHLPDEVEAVLREVLRTRYLTRQRRSVAAVHPEIARVCRGRGLRVPSEGSLVRRISKLDPVTAASAGDGSEGGAGAARGWW